jgi:hypothetical protein
MDAHNQKNKEELQKKSRYSDLFIVAADQTPPGQHQKSIFSKSDIRNHRS